MSRVDFDNGVSLDVRVFSPHQLSFAGPGFGTGATKHSPLVVTVVNVNATAA